MIPTSTEPYYLPLGDEVEVFEAAYRQDFVHGAVPHNLAHHAL